eukprot:c24416_g1_i1.p1 GENE.c24416_g1_i1~~c24416_g1_i1.p1  ORF type:complete len:163 (-),score=65.25 c24416_g1_i1:104-592(-)
MNIFTCWFGGMPMCHGAGGLAGQYRCGARSNAAILFLGICNLLLAVFVGNIFLNILLYFPNPILGSLLAMSAIELATTSCHHKMERNDLMITLITAFSISGFDSISSTKTTSSALGAAVGILVFVTIRFFGLFPSSKLLDSNQNTDTDHVYLNSDSKEKSNS